MKQQQRRENGKRKNRRNVTEKKTPEEMNMNAISQ